MTLLMTLLSLSSVAIRPGCSKGWLRRNALWLLFSMLALWLRPAMAQQELRFGVLGLFHPKELVLEPIDGQVLSISGQGAANGSMFVLNGEPGHRQLVFRVEGARVSLGTRAQSRWSVTARDGGMGSFRLIVPGKIRRVYTGKLQIETRNGQLLAMVVMDRETAVASIVAAEMTENSPMEALKAQAVVTRSFLLSGARHPDFDFCDTTHCQFLKSPPSPVSRVARAVEATRGLVIAYRGKPLAAMYSSRCGGETHSLRDAGAEPGEGYPYYAVACAWCRRHAFTWQSTVGKSDRMPQPGNERARVAAARQWGWSAVPGNDFTATKEDDGWRLKGHSIGHGIGMCQHGASGMATEGATFRQILAHYYPNTQLTLQP